MHFGRYDKLVEQVNIDVAKEYFEKAEKTEIPKRKFAQSWINF